MQPHLVDSSELRASPVGPRPGSVSRRTSAGVAKCRGPSQRSRPVREISGYQPRRWDGCRWRAVAESCPAGRCWEECRSMPRCCLNSDGRSRLVLPGDRSDQSLHQCEISSHRRQAPAISREHAEIHGANVAGSMPQTFARTKRLTKLFYYTWCTRKGNRLTQLHLENVCVFVARESITWPVT